MKPRSGFLNHLPVETNGSTTNAHQPSCEPLVINAAAQSRSPVSREFLGSELQLNRQQ